MPRTSFHSTTVRAPIGAASSVAVRSDPPRPSVVGLPSGAWPMKPGTTGVVPAASSGRSARRARRPVSGRLGAAPPCWLSVATISAASTYCAPSALRQHRGEQRGRHALAAGHQDVAGARRRCGRARRSRRTARGTRAPTRRSWRAACAAPGPRAAARGRCPDAGAGAPPRPGSRRPPCPAAACAAPSSSWSVTPASADATTTSGPGMPGDEAGGALNRARVGQRRPAELPHFETATLYSAHGCLSVNAAHGRGQFVDRAADRVVAVRQFDRGVGIARRHAVERARVIRDLELGEFQPVGRGDHDHPIGRP